MEGLSVTSTAKRKLEDEVQEDEGDADPSLSTNSFTKTDSLHRTKQQGQHQWEKL